MKNILFSTAAAGGGGGKSRKPAVGETSTSSNKSTSSTHSASSHHHSSFSSQGKKSSDRRSKSSQQQRRSRSPGPKSYRNDHTNNNNSKSRSPTRRQHHPKSKSPNNRRGSLKRPDAVVFPPDPRETGEQVVNRVFCAFGLSEAFPSECQDYVKDLLKKEEAAPPRKAATRPSISYAAALKNNNFQTYGRHRSSMGPTTDGYTDCTHMPFITIDTSSETQDLDQAMCIVKQNLPGRPQNEDDMGYLVSYALADGAYYCAADSAVFQHALQKGGTSFYLPGKSIPMLPRELSDNYMSLLPHKKRRALLFDMYLNSEGHPLKTFFHWGYIQSRWKGTYQEVSMYYRAKDSNVEEHHPLFDQEHTETLDLLREVGQLRRQLAHDRHVVEQHSSSRVKVTIGSNGKLILSKRNTAPCDAELYNEQISLLCNSEGAKILHFLTALDEKTLHHDIVHPIYRTQSKPLEEKLEALREVISNTLEAHKIDAQQHGWNADDDDESIAEYLQRIRERRDKFDVHSPEYRVWSAVVQVVERQAMQCNVAATFSARNSQTSHFGLQLEYYARFSSPMRELVGCFTHKCLQEAHTGRSKLTTETDIALRDNVIRAARRAKILQKKLSGAVFLHMMNLVFYRDLKKSLTKRPVRKGVLMGINFSEERNKSRRCYVQLEDSPAIEIKVFAQDLEYFFNCRYVVLRRRHPNTYCESACTTAVAIGPLAGSFKEDVDDQDRPPVFKVGQRVTIRLADYAQFYGQTNRSRWCFIMDVQQEEEQPDVARLNRRSVLRNSILDIDLFSHRNSTGSTTTYASSEGSAVAVDDFEEDDDDSHAEDELDGYITQEY